MLWSCTDLSVAYRQDDGKETIALRDINLSIKSGERIAILGPNGSGKSTLALIIAGLIQPTSGRVLYNDMPADIPTGALVFQSPDDNLLGETVREELRFCLEQYVPWQQLDLEVDLAISRFGIASLADRKTSQLSGGEKQIVAVACAMMSQRSIIVLDEPTSHLDREGKKFLWSFLDAAVAGEDPRAIVVVTQYAHEVSHFDRVVALDSDTIILDGPPLPVSHPPESPIQRPINPTKTNRQPILTVNSLSQVETPGWELPENPLRDITLSINHGETIALCGPIGSGKTTLALHLAGLISKFDGKRIYQGRPPVMIMQFPERQIFCKSVEEEVAYGLIARGMSKPEALSQSRDALKRVGLDPAEFGHRDPFSLSGGQKRRVMLAMASSIPSDLYILDEPQASLDDDGIAAVDTLCRSWNGQESAYMLISHDLEFLRSLTGRVIVLESGRVCFDGTWSQFDLSHNYLPSN